MSNIYLNVTIEKKWLTQNFDFKSLILNWILKLLIATKKSEVLEQSCVWLFYYFNFERNYDISKSNGSCILLNENINFNKSKTETKIENSTHNFRETNPVLQLIKELQIKSKTVISWSSQKNREGFFLTFILSEWNFFDIYFLSQCIAYWIHFQNIDTFIYQKALIHILFCLFLKSLEALSVSLKKLF